MPYIPFDGDGDGGETRSAGDHPDPTGRAGRQSAGRGYRDETDPRIGSARRAGTGARDAYGMAEDGGSRHSRYPGDGHPDSEDRYAGWTDPSQEQFDLGGSGEWTRANRAWSGRGAGIAEQHGPGVSVSDLDPSPRTSRTPGRNKKPLGRTTQGRKAASQRPPESKRRSDLQEPPPARRGARPDREPRTKAARPDTDTRRRPAGAERTKPATGSRRTVRPVIGLAGAIAKLPGRVLVFGAVAIVAVLAAGGYFLFTSSGPAHVITIPSGFAGYTASPSLATATHEEALQKAIVSGAAGEVRNVKSQVYEQAAAPGSKASPQIMGFIGGNLTGGSASNMISDVMSLMRGSFSTDPGPLGGQAACAAGSQGGPAICAWADNDTFGVVFSPTLSPSGLATVMRQLRPLAEHLEK